jgi:hypothetical protein
MNTSIVRNTRAIKTIRQPARLLCEIDTGVEDRIQAGWEYVATDVTYRAGMPFYYIPGHGWFHSLRFKVIEQRGQMKPKVMCRPRLLAA